VARSRNPTPPQAAWYVQREIADAEHDQAAAPIGPPRESLQASQDLRESVRFGEVVVAACPHPFHTIGGTADRAQHQNGRDGIPLSQPLDQRQAVQDGQPPVNDQSVVNPLGRESETDLAIRRAIDDVAALGQTSDQMPRGPVVILHDEQAHVTLGRVTDFLLSGEADFGQGASKIEG
jgi:hypothetical protein